MSDTSDPVTLIQLAEIVGRDWTAGPYYDQAEAVVEAQWAEVWPLICDCDLACTVEVAAGHGRFSERLRHLARRLYLVDINIENIDFLRQRFGDADNVVLVHNNGVDLQDLPSGEATFVYSFDAMVHFDSDVIRAYLREFQRVLRPGGHGFVHYSNYTGNPTGSYRDHPGWRNFMSRELFEHYAAKEGLTPLRSQFRNAVETRHGLRYDDAVTLFRSGD